MTIKQIGNEFRGAGMARSSFASDHFKLVEPEREHWNVDRTV